MRLGFCFLWLASVAAAAGLQFLERRFAVGPLREVSGCALDGKRLVCWGDGIASVSLPGGEARALVPPGMRRYAEGGCVTDVDGDGLADIIVAGQSPRKALTLYRAPRWNRLEIDTGVEAHEILPAVIHGRKGVLLVHKGGQLRFYWLDAKWACRDIYSFYTPSDQGGLVLADIDGDGYRDILCGNYWVRSPSQFELPWRLFALNLWKETWNSANLRLLYAALFGAGAQHLIASQVAVENARLAWFEKPSDPRQLWVEHRIENQLNLNRCGGLAVADFDGDDHPEILAAESAGQGRVFLFHATSRGQFTALAISTGTPVHRAWAIDITNDRRPDIVGAGASGIYYWENRPSISK